MKKLLTLLTLGALLAAPASAYQVEPVKRNSGGWIHDQPFFNYPHYSQRPECKPDEQAIQSPYQIGKWICVNKRDLYRFDK